MKRTTAATVLTALALGAALTACSSSDDAAPKTPAKSSAPAKDMADAEAAAGIPPKPTGQARADLLAALRKISPALAADEAKAIDNARNQCMAINGKAQRLTWSAQQRFGTSAHEVSEAEAKQINDTLTAMLCKTA
ncbi:hypothetical protein [Streptomyces sp. NPDC056690]|uniref:hypothetical protein n=1 Tax=unclassified Streptomyces TaxID=2593676 RepID=UPI00363F09B8